MPLDSWSATLERDSHLVFQRSTFTTHSVFLDSDLKPLRLQELGMKRCNNWKSQFTGKKRLILLISSAAQSLSLTEKVSKWSAIDAWTATLWSTTTVTTALAVVKASWETWLASILFLWLSSCQLLTSPTKRWSSVSGWTHQKMAPKTSPEWKRGRRSIKMGGKKTGRRVMNRLSLSITSKMTLRTTCSPSACLNSWRTKWTQTTTSQLRLMSVCYSTWDMRRYSSWTTPSSAQPRQEGSSRTWCQTSPSPCVSAAASASFRMSMNLHTSRRDTAHSARISKKIRESKMCMEV